MLSQCGQLQAFEKLSHFQTPTERKDEDSSLHINLAGIPRFEFANDLRQLRMMTSDTRPNVTQNKSQILATSEGMQAKCEEI
eukprot:9292220-Pyramimonas_sp.AAC.1